MTTPKCEFAKYMYTYSINIELKHCEVGHCKDELIWTSLEFGSL